MRFVAHRGRQRLRGARKKKGSHLWAACSRKTTKGASATVQRRHCWPLVGPAPAAPSSAAPASRSGLLSCRSGTAACGEPVLRSCFIRSLRRRESEFSRRTVAPRSLFCSFRLRSLPASSRPPPRLLTIAVCTFRAVAQLHTMSLALRIGATHIAHIC